jgi:hypothetical protein
VLDRCGGAEMCLQRHVTEIFERNEALLVAVSQNRRHWQRDFGEQFADVGKGERREVDGTGVEREDD